MGVRSWRALADWTVARAFGLPDGHSFRGNISECGLCLPTGSSAEKYQGSLSTNCPTGTVFVGDCCGDCAPADRKTCLSTRGWKWTDAGCVPQGASR